ncbi:unnamed protein product [Effrenium voratum]|uniref:galactosylceramidase n=1 Tax=Effrenium voratum TaxID=2562239 RepID=A0AA36MFY6_9DINO|nr:unnamed protein product [Effrenium voratum]CAJ1420500.1 unnamed protein product [Effrenium voratum]
MRDIRRPKACPANGVLDAQFAEALRFDGVGAVSARGTSRYLYDYAEPMRSEMLDLLFLPGYAASIQVLKVEIGGDAQSGFGTEPSHRRSEDQVACNRSRAFWLVREARRRNPSLSVLAAAWALPAWLGLENASQIGFYNSDTIDYIVSWIRCANETGAGAVEYVGSRPRAIVVDQLGQSQGHPGPPLSWSEDLRTALDAAGFSTSLVLPDAEYDPSVKLPEPGAAMAGGAVGLHYPCFLSLPELRSSPLALWSTEDAGVTADWPGAACAGRLVNTNLVRMNVTSTIVRSLAWALHPALPGARDGLLLATEPWSGAYSIQDPLWTLAHTTRFTEAGWYVLPLQSGATGHLKKGGTFVTYLSPSRDEFTLVVEKLQAKCGTCAGSITGAEELVFTLAGGLEELSNMSNDTSDTSETELSNDDSTNQSDVDDDEVQGFANASNETNATANVTQDGLAFFLTNRTHKMLRLPPLPVSGGSFRFVAEADTIYTVTSRNDTEVPAIQDRSLEVGPFPVPYRDDFERYEEDEPRSLLDTPGYFADYGGSFQVSHDPAYFPNMVLKQWIMEKAGSNRWTSASDPITLIGHRLANVAVTVDVFLPRDQPQEPVRLGIQGAWAGGCLSTAGSVRELAQVQEESCDAKTAQDFVLERSTGQIVIASGLSMAKSCLTAHTCMPGPHTDPTVCARPCGSQRSNQTWAWEADGSLRLRERPDLCLTRGKESMPSLHLANCAEPVLPTQRFVETGDLPLYAGVCLRLAPRSGSAGEPSLMACRAAVATAYGWARTPPAAAPGAWSQVGPRRGCSPTALLPRLAPGTVSAWLPRAPRCAQESTGKRWLPLMQRTALAWWRL